MPVRGHLGKCRYRIAAGSAHLKSEAPGRARCRFRPVVRPLLRAVTSRRLGEEREGQPARRSPQ